MTERHSPPWLGRQPEQMTREGEKIACVEISANAAAAAAAADDDDDDAKRYAMLTTHRRQQAGNPGVATCEQDATGVAGHRHLYYNQLRPYGHDVHAEMVMKCANAHAAFISRDVIGNGKFNVWRVWSMLEVWRKRTRGVSEAGG